MCVAVNQEDMLACILDIYSQNQLVELTVKSISIVEVSLCVMP